MMAIRQSRWIGLLLLSLFALPAGCPDSGSKNGSITRAAAAAPETAEVGGTVNLAVAIIGEGDLSAATYRWFQTTGRVVSLSDPASAEPTFVAPSLPTDTTLGFRVDVSLGGAITSSEITVMVFADPTYGLDNSNSNGSGDDDPFPQVRLTTSKGEIVLELNRDKAPVSVNNFLKYVDDKFYNNTIFHRVIPEFVVQGGGFTTELEQKDTRDPILNESTNGLKNVRGSLAMARTDQPNSATAQFFVNLINNTSLDRTDRNAGYAVFGRVIVGMSVIDDIAEVETHTERIGFDDVPVEDVILRKAERTSGVTPE